MFFKKKQPVENPDKKALEEIKRGLLDYIEANGGKWVDHGTDDNDWVCYLFRGKTIGVSTGRWDIDGKLVPFNTFLEFIARRPLFQRRR